VSTLSEIGSVRSTGTAAQLSVRVVGGQSYQISVDGVDGADGVVLLQNSFVSTPTLARSANLSTNGFNFNITGVTNQVWTLEASTNLTSWNVLASVTNLNGTIQYTDPQALSLGMRFYRARLGP
jgi:hypothetical protein